MPARSARATLPGTRVRLDELPAEIPRFVRKMDCVAVSEVDRIPSTDLWFREVKWDGYRICVIRQPGIAALRTKSNMQPGARYQHIEQSVAQSKLPPCVLDGELVALYHGGRPSFQLLQQSRRNRALIVLYVFDLLNYAGRDLKKLPLERRRAALEAIAPEFPEGVRLSELLPEDVAIDRLVRALDENRLEGIIVKRKSSTYHEGRTSEAWVKFRLYKIGEFTIGGYLKRDDPFFDALIVGERNGSEFHYKEKVRFGFDDEKKADLLRRMEPLRVARCPFANLPEKQRRGSLSTKQMREAVWVRPVLRCTVEYTEKTEAGKYPRPRPFRSACVADCPCLLGLCREAALSASSDRAA